MLKEIPLSAIKENKVALRTVDRNDERYAGLVDSISEQGILNPISVRTRKDKETGEEYFELVDGLHRYMASRDAGLEIIPAQVTDMDDDSVLEAQIIANIHRIETKPKEYSDQLKRILTRNPMMTEAELAKKLCKSDQWIKNRLNLNRITDDTIGSLIDEGRIPLSNAYALAKLPPEEQKDWVDRAITEKPDQFVPQVAKRNKEISDERRKGKNAKPAEFQPTAHMQKMKDIKAELEEPENVKTLVAKHNLKKAEEVIKMTLSWVLHLDPENVEIQKEKDEERKRKREEAKKKRAAERAKKKAEEAEKEAQEAAEAAAKLEGGEA